MMAFALDAQLAAHEQCPHRPNKVLPNALAKGYLFNETAFTFDSIASRPPNECSANRAQWFQYHFRDCQLPRVLIDVVIVNGIVCMCVCVWLCMVTTRQLLPRNQLILDVSMFRQSIEFINRAMMRWQLILATSVANISGSHTLRCTWQTTNNTNRINDHNMFSNNVRCHDARTFRRICSLSVCVCVYIFIIWPWFIVCLIWSSRISAGTRAQQH